MIEKSEFNNIEEFDEAILSSFGNIRFDTLNYSILPSLRIEFDRINIVGLKRVFRILSICNVIFKVNFRIDEDIWIRIIFWDKNNLENQTVKKLIQQSKITFKKYVEGETVSSIILLIKVPNHFIFFENLIRNMVEYHIDPEKGFEVMMYFITFENGGSIINVYDDRGMDLIIRDEERLLRVTKKINSELNFY